MAKESTGTRLEACPSTSCAERSCGLLGRTSPSSDDSCKNRSRYMPATTRKAWSAAGGRGLEMDSWPGASASGRHTAPAGTHDAETGRQFSVSEMLCLSGSFPPLALLPLPTKCRAEVTATLLAHARADTWATTEGWATPTPPSALFQLYKMTATSPKPTAVMPTRMPAFRPGGPQATHDPASPAPGGKWWYPSAQRTQRNESVSWPSAQVESRTPTKLQLKDRPWSPAMHVPRRRSAGATCVSFPPAELDEAGAAALGTHAKGLGQGSMTCCAARMNASASLAVMPKKRSPSPGTLEFAGADQPSSRAACHSCSSGELGADTPAPSHLLKRKPPATLIIPPEHCTAEVTGHVVQVAAPARAKLLSGQGKQLPTAPCARSVARAE